MQQMVNFAQEAVTTNQFNHRHVVKLLFVSGGELLGGGLVTRAAHVDPTL
jgi:hypothetical protein